MNAVGKPAACRLLYRLSKGVIVAELRGIAYEKLYGPVAGDGPAAPEMVVPVVGVLIGKFEVIVYVCDGEKNGVVNEEVPRGFVETDGVTCAYQGYIKTSDRD